MAKPYRIYVEFSGVMADSGNEAADILRVQLGILSAAGFPSEIEHIASEDSIEDDEKCPDCGMNLWSTDQPVDVNGQDMRADVCRECGHARVHGDVQ